MIKYFLFLYLASLPIAQVAAEVKTDSYKYERTKDLMDYVQSAAKLFEREGQKAYPLFRDRNGKWFCNQQYLFVYDLNGTNVFHPVNPELEGKNLIDLTDLDGKPVIKYIIATGTEREEPYGWVHYSWLEPGQIFPRWKSSFVMKVTAPSGQDYIIGSGIYNIRMEKQFIINTVDDAAKLIKQKGKKAFDVFKNKSSNFVYMDTYIFVISMDGKAIVDPAFPSRGERNLMDLKDATGKYLVRAMIEKLKNGDSGWVSYMWPKQGEVRPSRKAAYIRKVKVGDQYFIVGSAIFLADPIWLKL